MAKKIRYALLEGKSEKGIKKLGHRNGEKWIVTGEVEGLKFVRSQGPSYVMTSRDGLAVIFVKKTNEIDYNFRLLY